MILVEHLMSYCHQFKKSFEVIFSESIFASKKYVEHTVIQKPDVRFPRKVFSGFLFDVSRKN